MKLAGMVLIGLAAVLSIAFGIRYLLTRQFMPYHATIAGKTWESLEPRLQTIILGMLRVAGAGLLGNGMAQAWLLVGLWQGAAWAAWAIVTIALATITPILFTVLWLRRVEPAAKTPLVPTALGLSLAVVGALLALAS